MCLQAVSITPHICGRSNLLLESTVKNALGSSERLTVRISDLTLEDLDLLRGLLDAFLGSSAN